MITLPKFSNNVKAVKGLCFRTPKTKLVEWLEDMREESRLYCSSLSLTYFKSINLAYKHLL